MFVITGNGTGNSRYLEVGRWNNPQLFSGNGTIYAKNIKIIKK